ncbi:hypothetical protein ACHAXA_011616 [Cyclostephanos tholiformis]|uniref:Uncharacterized protein n=1 Tax=Cyclostephanos tholiformis TaxID=382380 RepID=A0ABD3RV93_9STRA
MTPSSSSAANSAHHPPPPLSPPLSLPPPLILLLILLLPWESYSSSSIVALPSHRSYSCYSSSPSSSPPSSRAFLPRRCHYLSAHLPVGNDVADIDGHDAYELHDATTRRAVLHRALLAATTTLATNAATNTMIDGPSSTAANAAVGTLPEYADASAILQSLTIDVSDASQYYDTLNFFDRAFDMRVLRERITEGGGGITRESWLGFGPEDLEIPSDFVLPVSSFARYGGHSSLHVRYDGASTASSSSTNVPLYLRSPGEYNESPAPGNNVAYLQLGVPTYRISQMVKFGGNVLDAYGWVNVICPAGLPVRAVVGVRNPDPMMFVALYCDDVEGSANFYANIGFAKRDYPYARPNDGGGQFEPPQPRGSIYVSPSANSMGILLLPREKKGGFFAYGSKQEALIPNPVLRSLNVVYAPTITTGGDAGAGADDGGGALATMSITDPSYVPISFISQDAFARELKATAIPPVSP